MFKTDLEFACFTPVYEIQLVYIDNVWNIKIPVLQIHKSFHVLWSNQDKTHRHRSSKKCHNIFCLIFVSIWLQLTITQITKKIYFATVYYFFIYLALSS